MKPIPYGRQDITEDDIAAVRAVLESDWITQGPAIAAFEERVARYCGARHAVAVSSATAALHIGCLALGLGEGDLLWTSPNTFVASANCARYCGADVGFVDVDPRTDNMDPDDLENRLGEAERSGRLPRVVVPVHFAGLSCDMARIAALSRKYGFSVMEDASHALGGSYRGARVGSCVHSDLVVLSFHPVKIITTGEGGMLLTNSGDLYERLLRLRTHGITRDPRQMDGPSHGLWYYQQVELGYNYRMTDIQAALGVSQMDRLDAFIERRRMLADRYDDALRNLPLRLPGRTPGVDSAWHLYAVHTREGLRARVFDGLRDAGINANVHYIPVHTQPYYRSLGFREGDYPNAETHYRRAISLPMHYGLSTAEQDYVIETLGEVLQA